MIAGSSLQGSEDGAGLQSLRSWLGDTKADPPARTPTGHARLVQHEEEGEEDDVSVLLADSFASSSDVGSGEVEAELRKRFRVARDGSVRSWEEVREEAATVLQRQVRPSLKMFRYLEREEGTEDLVVWVVCLLW